MILGCGIEPELLFLLFFLCDHGSVIPFIVLTQLDQFLVDFHLPLIALFFLLIAYFAIDCDLSEGERVQMLEHDSERLGQTLFVSLMRYDNHWILAEVSLLEDTILVFQVKMEYSHLLIIATS